MNEEQVQRKLAAIFLADVAGYSRLMRDDEMATFNTLSAYREVIINLIRQHRGRVVDTSGDNVLAEFSSVVDAMQSAVSIQKELRARNAQFPEHRKMQFRIGINIGDVIQEGDRIYGDGVNIAARLEALAEPGGICISRMAYDQIESKLPLGYEYIGEQVVKNISKPLHAYRVVIDPENRSRHRRETEPREFKRKHHHAKHEFRGERFEQSFQQVKGHLKDFAKDIKEDEQLSETFQEIKGRFRTFADDIASSPERRKRAVHNLIQNKHLQLFLGVACFLFLINAFISSGGWWFQYPLVSIGLVIYLHWLKTSFFSPEKVKAMRQRLLQKELARLDPKSQDIAEGKERAENQANVHFRFYKHLYVYVGVNAFLLLINLLTDPFSWWFHFPLLGWGICLFFHWMKLKQLQAHR
jgi:class 3 adenylate cyclase/Flp pilus assembly protein TadB